MLAVHETAEEMMVHPRVRRKVAGGDEIVDARLAEEHDSKVALAEIEKLDFGTAEFSKALIHLQAAVLQHAEKEETEEFPRLEDELDADGAEEADRRRSCSPSGSHRRIRTPASSRVPPTSRWDRSPRCSTGRATRSRARGLTAADCRSDVRPAHGAAPPVSVDGCRLPIVTR